MKVSSRARPDSSKHRSSKGFDLDGNPLPMGLETDIEVKRPISHRDDDSKDKNNENEDES